jgi:hypothetical protein
MGEQVSSSEVDIDEVRWVLMIRVDSRLDIPSSTNLTEELE